MFNITESPYWIVVDYCKRNIHVCWIFGPSLLSHGNGWFCFVGKKTFLLMRKNTSEVEMNWNLTHVTNTEVRSSGLSLLMMQIYSTNIHFLQMVITLWVQLGTVTMLVSNTSVHEGFFLVTSGKVGKHWRRGYSWWQWTLDPCCNMDDYSAIPNCRHLLWGTIYKFFKYTMEESTINL